MRDEKVREHVQKKEYSHVGKRTTQASKGWGVCTEQAAGAVAATPCHSSLLAENLLRSHRTQPLALLLSGRAAPQTSAMLEGQGDWLFHG